MRRIRRIFTAFLSLCLTVSLAGLSVCAAEEERYTYQVTFYTGNHGTFTGAGHVNVDNGRTGSDYQVRAGGDAIVVSGLQIGDRVNFDAAMDGAVSLGADSKYYVKGIRLSGRDNDTVGMSSFEVKGDQEYVVAYGIRGNMTSYVVNYQDTAGNPLATSRTYYGNVGDRPVIAFLYMEGYEPQAYNLTRTLSANAAENVFTFTYARVTAGGGGGGGAAGEEAAAPETPAPAPEGGAETPAAPAAPAGTPAAGGAPAAPAAPAGGGAAPAAPGGADAGVAAPDGEVPAAEGPQELQELDDEEVPLAGGEQGEEENAGANGIFGAVAIGGVAAVALIAILILWLKRRKKDDEDENDSDKE